MYIIRVQVEPPVQAPSQGVLYEHVTVTVAGR